MNPKNLIHVVFDNQVYEASGCGETATASGADLVGLALAAGIKKASWAASTESFAQLISEAIKGNELTFIGVKAEIARTSVPPFPMDEVENKYRFIRHIEATENIAILKTALPASYS